jgi:nucleotide-binding universal stress UspA family protein
MKKKFIVPVDFSATSQNAYLYARELAKVYDARIEVVHVYIGAININDPLVIKQGKGIAEVLQEQLDDLVGLHPQDAPSDVATKVDVSTRLVHGLTNKKLIEISKEDMTTMIIVGATGQGDALDKMMGSVSSTLAQKAYCPVLVVPKGAKFFGYENILYASNYESADNHMLERLIEFNKSFRAVLHFIHVNERKEDYDPIENKIFDKLFEQGEPSYAFNLASVQYGSVIKGLVHYAEENEVDLIVLVNRQRRFWESIIGASMTKKLSLRTRVPILVYHI